MSDPVKLAIIYYSSTGTVDAMARHAASMGEKSGAEVRLRHVEELAPDDVVATQDEWVEHRKAVADEALEVYYQPCLGLQSDRITGCEALVRWRHPERGMISPGTKLVDSKKRHGALVRADGAIMLGDKVGSIHRMGAVAQGSGACNGWTFWHIETKKGLRLIDELRAEIRSGMAAG